RVLEKLQCRNQLWRRRRSGDGERMPGFREFSVPRLQDQRQMSVARRGEAEGALQCDLPGSAVQKIGASHDMRDALLCIIHDDGKLIGQGSVASPYDRITERAQIKLARA